jgi:predicted small secreted protein
MKYINKAILLAFLVLSCIGALSGCRTAHGFGEDMEHAGEKVQEGTQ